MPRKHIWARPKRDRCDHISQLGRVISPRTCHRLLVPIVRTPTSLFHKGAQTAAAVPLRPDFNMHDTHPTSTSMHIDERGRQGGRKVIPKQSRLPRRQRQRPGSRSAATCADSRRDRRAGGAGALIPLESRMPHVCANARMPDLGMADVRLLLPVHDIGVRPVGPAHRPTAVSVLKVAMPSTEYRERHSWHRPRSRARGHDRRRPCWCLGGSGSGSVVHHIPTHPSDLQHCSDIASAAIVQ